MDITFSDVIIAIAFLAIGYTICYIVQKRRPKKEVAPEVKEICHQLQMDVRKSHKDITALFKQMDSFAKELPQYIAEGVDGSK